jgi:hypothetical protein
LQRPISDLADRLRGSRPTSVPDFAAFGSDVLPVVTKTVTKQVVEQREEPAHATADRRSR